MKAIILAAGEGSRLRPLTNDRPKALVPFQGRPLIEYALDSLRCLGIDEIIIVGGYRASMLEGYGTRLRVNDRWAVTNMVETFFSAESEFTDDLIVSYGDILYTPEVARALVESSAAISVTIDTEWRTLWEARMENPLLDAETLELNVDGTIRSLGKRPQHYGQIQGQYMGLLKYSKNALPAVRRFYHQLDRHGVYEGQPFEKMYMTTFLQLLIDRLMPVKAVPVRGGWLEIDQPSDLQLPFSFAG